MTQPPPPPAAANAATGPSSDAAGKTAEAELLRLRSACTDLSTQLHALSRTRRQLSAQVSILAVEAVEAGCRGELWITHEGKSNESKFHRVVRSSEITCGREYGEVVREEEMSGGAAGGGGSGAGAGSAKKGTSPTNNTAASAAAGAAAAAAGTTAGSDSPSAEIKHKLCCVPGCTKKEQGKWYGKMCKRHWAEKNPNKTSPKKEKDEARPEARSIQPIASFGDGSNQVAAAAASSEKNKGKVDNSIIPPPPPAKTSASDAAPTAATKKMAADPAVKAPAQQVAAAGGKVPTVAPAKPATKVDEKTTTTSPVAGEKRPAEAEATAASGAPSSSAQPSSGGHLPQKKRKVEIDTEAASVGAGAGAGAEPKAAPTKPANATSTTKSAAPTTTAPTAAAPSVKKDGIHQESGGKWSAAVLHTDGQSYGLGATFDTKELATLALGAFRSTLANESRAAGGRISESMVKQAREMARHAALAKGRGKGSGQKQK